MKTSIIFILLFFISCNNKTDKIYEVEKLTKLNFPKESIFLKYEDNYELQLSYKLKTVKHSLDKFITSNNFKVYDSTKMDIKRWSMNDGLIRIVEEDFNPKEKIPKGKNLYMYHNGNIVIIADKISNIIWGVISYSD
jgi:hypothetical protein